MTEIHGNTWPEQEAILAWWAKHRYELMSVASDYRTKNCIPRDKVRDAMKAVYLLLNDYKTEMQSWEGDGSIYAKSLVAGVEKALTALGLEEK